MAPADGKLYALRDVTGTVESLPLIASSIMSKKIAAGTSGVVLDVKVGRGAFMKTEADARALALAMRDIGESVGLKVRAVLSGMDQPLGQAVGNALEIREALDSLRGGGPQDLLEVAVTIGANLLEMAGRASSVDEGKNILQEALASGAGLAKFREFVENQGGDASFIDDPDRLPKAPIERDLPAPSGGYIAAFDAEIIGRASVDIGAGRKFKGDSVDHSVGFVLRAKLGDKIESGQPLITIHARDEQSAEDAIPELLRAIVIRQERVEVPPVIMDVVA
jgi:pyrimidine-nucleoside phosphorylase